MKKIAIFNYTQLSENKGGPSGYLYNLLKGMESISKTLPVIIVNKQNKLYDLNINVKNKKRKYPIIEEIRTLGYFLKLGIVYAKKTSKEVHSFEMLHVHSCEDVYYLKKFVKYKGKIILTSHRPETLSSEKISTLQLSLKTKWKFPILNLLMKNIEIYGYKNSSAYIFPSEGAKSIYNEFPGFIKYTKDKPIEYVFTGTMQKKSEISSQKYRDNLGLNEDDKLVCYIGRHNYIKGYDLLVNMEDKFEADNIKVLCAGANNGITAPIKDNWIELGHISDPENLINASDVVVIPNRNTYFDLIILEVLSMGKILITSNTGGNVDIAKYTKGVKLFQSGDSKDMYNKIKLCLNSDKEVKSLMGSDNYKFYMDNCTIEKFAHNYLKALDNLYIKLNNKK